MRRILDETQNPDTGINAYAVLEPQATVSKWIPWSTLLPTTTQDLNRFEKMLERYQTTRRAMPVTSDNGVSPKEVYLMIEAMFEGVVVPEDGSQLGSAHECHYILDMDTNTMSPPLTPEELQQSTKDWPYQYRPHAPRSPRPDTHGYIDHCLAVTQNVAKGSCSNVLGESFHSILETDLIKDFRVRLGRQHVKTYGYRVLSTANLQWARKQFAEQWRQRSHPDDTEADEFVHEFSHVRRLCAAIFDHYVDQLLSTERPIRKPQMLRRSSRLNPELVPSTTTDDTQPGTYVYDSTDTGRNIGLTTRTTAGLPTKDKSPWRTPNVVTLHPDILFCLDTPTKLRKGAVYDMGSAQYGRRVRNRLRNYTFSNRSRMCAIELKTSRNFPETKDAPLSTYTYRNVIHKNIVTVTRKYKQWMFNGTVFLIHVLYPFKKVVVSQIDINRYAGRNESIRYDLAHYYTHAAVPQE